jgi:hypothetical protein
MTKMLSNAKETAEGRTGGQGNKLIRNDIDRLWDNPKLQGGYWKIKHLF